jgi:hypothetical protein
MSKFVIVGAVALGLAGCQTVSNAVNMVSAAQGAIQQACQARVEYSDIEKLIVQFTSVGAKLEGIVNAVCNAIDPPSTVRSLYSAPRRTSGVVSVRGVAVKFTRV